MTDSVPSPPDFEKLRERAIMAAQAASGKLWTDFNLHDPGVTLLEQTVFALTEVGYRNAHATRDLLTGTDGVLDHDALALFDPAEMLPTDPVTGRDLAALISEAEGVARAYVRRSGRNGLYEVDVIPEPDPLDPDPQVADAVALDAARRAFYAHRPLCCDIDRIRVSRRRPVRLVAEVAIAPTALPGRVAAELYFHVGAILRGQADVTETEQSATRAKVYERPEVFLHAPAVPGESEPGLDSHLSVLRAIPGIAEIGPISLEDFDPQPGHHDRSPAADGSQYRELVLPDEGEPVLVILRLDGVALPLDAVGVREEYIRVATEHMARARHHLDARDWAVRRDGRRRNFAHVPVDSLLPALYRGRHAGLTPATADARRQMPGRGAPAQTDLAAYRVAIDEYLAGMSGTLAGLPRLLAAETARDTRDPAERRQRIKVLDYLIALQGEEMPPTRHAGLHRYRSRDERERFELEWRIRYLRALSRANAARGTGPNGTEPGGFLAKLSILADLRLGGLDALTAPMCRADLNPDPGAVIPPPGLRREDLPRLANPLEMRVPRDPAARPLEAGSLLDAAPWVADGRIHPDLFHRTADPDAWLVAPGATAEGWRVLFDAGNPEGLYVCGADRNRRRAQEMANRIRNGWRALHAAAEGVYLVEDILLRGDTQAFAPHGATLVLTGWTSRSRGQDYRAYVGNLVERLAPAHLLIRPLWLSFGEMVRFEELHVTGRPVDRARGAAIRSLLTLAGHRTRLEAAVARLAAVEGRIPGIGATAGIAS
ncbi:hypothetical protein [Rhodovulum steppense]|uniref:Uncharacterized protein n=1 Tax=Rhodovulum steppense TaxID=540251 RepID=A0A4R1YY12_9RHOB|nr:hypothetical protein [Rhodovulum steppense]TCM86119.1 hypothetical protein EV216_10584 [Rhodovulum steppense]